MSKKKAPAAKGAKPTAKAVKASGKARTPAKTPAASPASKTKAVAARAKAGSPVKPHGKPVAKKTAVKASAKAGAKPTAKASAPKSSKAAAKTAAKKPIQQAVKKAVKKKTVAAPPVKAKANAKGKAPNAASPKPKAPPAAPKAPPQTKLKSVTPSSAVKASPASKSTEPAKPAVSTAAVARPTAKSRSSSRHEAATQPVPAAPIHPANRFADRFAPAKTSARYLPEPMVDTKPATKPDPKLANAWKSKAGRDLSEAELLAMPEGEYMNDKQVEFFKARLTALKGDLLSNAGETTEHLREDTTIVPDPADRATIEEEHALELRTRDRERKLLRKISQSLTRIDTGEYGYCEETGEPIGLGRLLARPTATLSLEAQQRRELKQRMFGD